jgi:hypothetical protein
LLPVRVTFAPTAAEAGVKPVTSGAARPVCTHPPAPLLAVLDHRPWTAKPPVESCRLKAAPAAVLAR